MPRETIYKSILVSVISVCVFSFITYVLGIATSESQGLLGGLFGASLAFHGASDTRIDFIIGIMVFQFLAVGFGFFLGFVLNAILSKQKRNNINSQFILTMLFHSFLHGAQDGQKFFSLIVAVSLAFDGNITEIIHIIVLLVSITLSVGTFFGYNKIIKNIESMVVSSPKEWLSSDFSSLISILVSTILGVPISTTYIKISSIFGASVQANNTVNKFSFLATISIWILTFPVCMFISYTLFII